MPHIILFDGKCPFCRKSIETIDRLDWFGRFEFRDARRPENVPTGIAIEPERLLEQMHVVTSAGKVHGGFAAVRQIVGRLPILWPVFPLLWLPGAVRIGQRLYREVARRRFHLVPCRDGVCTIHQKA